MPVKSKHRSLGGFRGLGGLTAAAALLAGTAAIGPALAQPPTTTPSGLPVPRYVVLKYGEVNARQGPDENHRLLWIYKAKSLPVQVVAETREWRRICDPEGGLAWVHKRTTDGRRTAMRVQDSPLPLRASPKPEARVSAYLRGRSIAALDKCEKGWCRLKADGAAGWAPEGEIWGAKETLQCPDAR